MTFNWPTTGFTGSEVEAFETAYKELAEEIINTFTNLTQKYDNVSKLYPPYQSVDLMKVLLEEGLIYSSFIIKQRANNSGGGTNFDFSASPFASTLSETEFALFLKNAGCIFTPEEMASAWHHNNGSDSYWYDGSSPGSIDPYGLMGTVIQGGPNNGKPGLSVLIDGLMNGANGQYENLNWSEYWDIYVNNNPSGNGGMTFWEEFIIDFWDKVISYDKFDDAIADALRQYLSNDNTAITENHPAIREYLPELKNRIQETLDYTENTGMNRQWPAGHVMAGPLGGWNNSKRDLTDTLSAQELANWGIDVNAGDKVWEVTFYSEHDLDMFFGTARVTTNAAGQVTGVYDDFDFVYGNEIPRSHSGGSGQHGDDYNPSDITDGQRYQDQFGDNGWANQSQSTQGNFGKQLSDKTAKGLDALKGNIHRTTVINAKLDGRGYPVPIRIRF